MHHYTSEHQQIQTGELAIDVGGALCWRGDQHGPWDTADGWRGSSGFSGECWHWGRTGSNLRRSRSHSWAGPSVSAAKTTFPDQQKAEKNEEQR